MKVESKSYIEDVLKIKSMPRSAERRELAEYFARKHKTSYDTIMRDARKKPSKVGVRKKRSDAGTEKVKTPKKDIIMYNELIKAGKTKAEAIAIIAEENNKKISERTKTKMSKKLEQTPEADTEKTAFGNEVKTFIEKIWKLDNIAPGKKVKVKLGKLTAHLTRSDIEHIKSVVGVAINRHQYQESKKIPHDGDALIRAMLKVMLQEQMFIVMENNNLDSIGQISLILDRLDIAADIKNCSPNFKTLHQILQNEFKKDISIEETLALVEKYKPRTE